MIREFVKFRLEVIERRARFDKEKAEKRAHTLKGLLAALDRLDEIIALIRSSKNAEIAKEGLMQFDFTPKGDALDSFLGQHVFPKLGIFLYLLVLALLVCNLAKLKNV